MSIAYIPEDKRGGANPNVKVKRSKIRCAVCPKLIPLVAAREGDPYCSAECCRRDLGLPSVERPRAGCNTGKPRTHGTRSCYRNGCRCSLCREEEAARGRQRRARKKAA